MEIGIDSFAAVTPDASTARDASERLRHLVEEIALADAVGLDAFGVGEHHRAEFLDSAPTLILAAAAARTQRIRLTSAVTVLSAADPVRVFQEFATLDLLSGGRAEIVAGRGSFVEAFPLFGLRLDDYDALFEEKLDLLLRLRSEPRITWSGRFRAPLRDQFVPPRPLQTPLPVWVGVGGSPESFVRAGRLGVPLMVSIIGGDPARFRPLVDLYRDAWRRSGHADGGATVGLHAIGFVADTWTDAGEIFFPGYARLFGEVGRERGWPAPTRNDFEAARGPHGALFVGSPDDVAHKMRHVAEVLGGLVRISLQMTMASMPHERMLRSIELLGRAVAPRVRDGDGIGGGARHASTGSA